MMRTTLTAFLIWAGNISYSGLSYCSVLDVFVSRLMLLALPRKFPNSFVRSPVRQAQDAVVWGGNEDEFYL